MNYAEEFYYEKLICPVCGKEFKTYCERRDYGWTLKQNAYCSYTCMRKVEKEILPKVEEVVEQEPTVEKLKQVRTDYREIYGDLRQLHDLSCKSSRLKRRLHNKGTSDEVKQFCRDRIKKLSIETASLKYKYSIGIKKLTAYQYELLSGFCLKGWGRTHIQQKYNISYEKLVTEFEGIMRILKKTNNTNGATIRWIRH